jgi:MFS superfamily sulfate permease-like transporter
VLASILVFIGYKLCKPKVWMHMAKIGKEQLVIFTTTVLVTVTTDLLIGIIVGVAMKLALCLWYNVRAARGKSSGKQGLLSPLTDLVRNPVGRHDYVDGTYAMVVDRPLVCFNLFHLIREMDRVPADAKAVNLQLTDRVSIIDHTTYENLLHYMEEYNSHDEKPNLSIEGLERMHSTSSDKTSIRLANGKVPATVSSAR